MLQSGIISQLITMPMWHVSKERTMLKIFCASLDLRLRSLNCGPSATTKSNSNIKRNVNFKMPSQRLDDHDSLSEDHFKAQAQILWDYLRIDSPLKKSDLIFVLGNSDLRTADYAATLYAEGYAPLVVVSGKSGHGTKGKWNKPEAMIFAEQLLKKKVPYESILLEPQATNTGENICFTQKLLQKYPSFIQPKSLILVQTPFMGRRSLATFLKQWDNADKVEVMVSSPHIPLEEYPDPEAGYSCLTDIAIEMVRNMQRIEEYPKCGYQVPQKVPSEVHEAYRSLQQILSGHVPASNA